MSSTQGTINTQENESKAPDENLVKLLLILAFIAVSPVTVVAALIVYVLFSYIHIRRSVIMVFSAPIFLGVLIFIKPAIESFIMAWKETLPALVRQTVPAGEGILTMLGQQFWIGLPIGILVGLGFATWRWFTRARWKETKFRRTPWEILRYKRNVEKIRNDEDSPMDGMTLGIDVHGNRVVQTNEEASAHTFIVGGSGSGKSRTAMMRIRDQIKKGEGFLGIDLKADPEFAAIVKIYAERYGRKFQHFTLQDITKPYEGPAPEGNAHYDPLAQGDHTRRADMVLDLREWDASADFFKKMTQSYFQLMFAVLINNPRPNISTLEDAIDLMSPKYLQERARPLAGDPRFATFVRSIDALNDEKLSNNVRDNLQTNRSQLEIFLQGIAGPWLMLDTKNGNNISLLETAYKGDVVFFSLDSQAYPSLAADLANLIIQDLKTVSSELLRVPADKPFNVFIDEFSAIGSDNIIGLINKARAAKMSVTLATQTLSDLESKSRNLSLQIIGIISSFIIHRANYEEDAKVYAGLTGTTTVNKIRHSVDYQQGILGGIGSGIGTGAASVEEIDQYQIMPVEIQKLNRGELFYINTEKHRVEKVRVIIEDIANPETGGTKNVIQPTQTPVLVNSTYPTSSAQNQNPFEPIVNREFTPTPPQMMKDSDMVQPKDNNSATSSQADPNYDPFAEAKDSKKVPINYDLLRTFFNHKSDVDNQEQEDIADGVLPVTGASGKASPTAPAAFPPAAKQLPAKPNGSFPQRPMAPALPQRPTPAKKTDPPRSKKDEFEF